MFKVPFLLLYFREYETMITVVHYFGMLVQN